MDKKRQEDEFAERIKRHSDLLSRFRGKGMLWHSIATFGVIGWMIALPTVMGAYLGKFLDSKTTGPEGISWTITGILIGLGIGIYTVWRFFFYRRRR
ncbi:MAG: ATPase F0F1 [Nitrospirae bacterium]|nr:MAG: ATPase F0F1 [Nitrospirota bacterium]